MKICQRHWDMMRAAVEARGMSPLVASSGRAAMENTVNELKGGQAPDNFDPLMAMNWNICGNAMEKLGPAAMYLLAAEDVPEDPIDIERLDEPTLQDKYRGKTWPRCPLCYMNISHEFTCRETRCCLTRVDGYDVAIEWSADGAKAQFDKLMGTK